MGQKVFWEKWQPLNHRPSDGILQQHLTDMRFVPLCNWSEFVQLVLEMPSPWSWRWLQGSIVCLRYSVSLLKHFKATHHGLQAFGCSGRPPFDDFNTGVYTVIIFSVHDFKTFSNAALSWCWPSSYIFHQPEMLRQLVMGPPTSSWRLETGTAHWPHHLQELRCWEQRCGTVPAFGCPRRRAAPTSTAVLGCRLLLPRGCSALPAEPKRSPVVAGLAARVLIFAHRALTQQVPCMWQSPVQKCFSAFVSLKKRKKKKKTTGKQEECWIKLHFPNKNHRVETNIKPAYLPCWTPFSWRAVGKKGTKHRGLGCPQP